MHYFDYNENIAECTRSGREPKITEPPFSEKPKECTTEKYLKEGCRIYRETGRILSSASQKAGVDNKIDRLIEVVSAHDAIIAPLVAEAKTPSISPEVSVSPSSASTQVVEFKDFSADIEQLRKDVTDLQNQLKSISDTNKPEGSEAQQPTVNPDTLNQRCYNVGAACGSCIGGLLDKCTIS